MSSSTDNLDHDPAALAEALDSTWRLASELVFKARQHGVSIDAIHVYVYPSDPSVRRIRLGAAIESLTPVLALALGLPKERTQPHNGRREEIAVYRAVIEGVEVTAQWSYPTTPEAVAS